MNKKNITPKRAFIAQSIGDTIKKINRNFTSKFGKIEFIIHSNWSKIVGSYFCKHTEPKNISRMPDYENDLGETIYKNYLKVEVTPAVALEFQHFKDTIIEKINSYFGYKAISDLRLQQNFVPEKKIKSNINLFNQELSEEEKAKIKSEINNIKDKELEKSIVNLGASINREDK